MLHFSKLRKSARNSLHGRWGLAIGTFLLYSFLSLPFDFVLTPFYYYYQIVNVKIYDNSEIFALLFSHLKIFANPKLLGDQIENIDSIWSILVGGGLYLAYNQIFLAIVRNNVTSIRSLFTYFRNGKLFLRGFLSQLLLNIYVALWSLLLVIPGIIKSLSYAMTNYILIDHPELSVNEAITQSRRLMHGHKWLLFVLTLSFVGWGFICLVSLGIGFIWLSPYMEATYAQFYLEVRDKNAYLIIN